MHSPVDGPASGVGTRAALASIIGFWLFYFGVASLRAAVLGFDDPLDLAVRRGVVALVSMGISWAMWRVLRRLGGAGFGRAIAVAAALSVPAALGYATVNARAFGHIRPHNARSGTRPDTAGLRVGDDRAATAPSSDRPSALALIADTAVNGYFFFTAWSALFLALAYAAEVGAAERRAAAFRSAAQAAELRALRYQVNPHFLFNTLNSLSSLVMTGRSAEAERMILNLATFFRSSLSGDPAVDTPLADEIALQRLYLAIEAVRFPDRVRLVEDIAPEAELAFVPGLILQPLVENAVKHGVARATGPVTIAIRGWIEDGMLALTVRDDATPQPPSHAESGSGIGLRNVADRLAARFGDAALCRAGAVAEGGYAVTLLLPVVTHA